MWNTTARSNRWPEGNMRVEGVIFGRGNTGGVWRYHSAINRTSARNKQSIFVLLSYHQKYTLIDEITGLYLSWIVDKNTKNTSQFHLVAGSPKIHLSAYFSLWRIHGVQWMTFLWDFWYYLKVSNGSKYSLHRYPSALWKVTSSAIWQTLNTRIYCSL